MPQAPRHDPKGPLSRAKPAPAEEVEQPDTDPPKWLTENARPAWNAAVELLTRVRVVAKSDLTALARYCQLLQEWIELTDNISEEGHAITDRFGQPKLNPCVTARDSIERSIRSLEKALGLDPQSYIDLTRDLARQVKDKNRVKGRRSVGGFLKQGDPK
jgi:P27 family predicted phage terminase small subunit